MVRSRQAGEPQRGARFSALEELVSSHAGEQAHIPVMADSVLAALAPRFDGCYVDATFGRGGHSGQLLAQLGPDGRLFAFDRDADAVAAAEERFGDDPRFSIAHRRFGDMAEQMQDWGIAGQVDGVLFDLGVSSVQLDEAERGFSFQSDGPLDMRMDRRQSMTAASWINSATEREIADVLWRYGEEKASRRIARAIVNDRQETPFERTSQLARLIGSVLRKSPPGKHPATRSFQAIRIFINDELGDVERALEASLGLLKADGRLVVLSFHSLEDRLVKRFIQHHARTQQSVPGTPESVPVTPSLSLVGRRQRPTEEEVVANPRARSATLRVAQRC
jgi:16S rRNA (cytosine1402-N4)-methyltransferase